MLYCQNPGACGTNPGGQATAAGARALPTTATKSSTNTELLCCTTGGRAMHCHVTHPRGILTIDGAKLLLHGAASDE